MSLANAHAEDEDASFADSEPASEPSMSMPTTRERFGFPEGSVNVNTGTRVRTGGW
jgi:hypothetical protein